MIYMFLSNNPLSGGYKFVEFALLIIQVSFLLYVNNKNADQLLQWCSLISAFAFSVGNPDDRFCCVEAHK